MKQHCHTGLGKAEIRYPGNVPAKAGNQTSNDVIEL